MELSKGATIGIIAAAVVLVLGLGWFIFLRPPGGGGPVRAGNAPNVNPTPSDPYYDRLRAMNAPRNR